MFAERMRVVVGAALLLPALVMAQAQAQPAAETPLTIGALARNQAKAIEAKSVSDLKKALADAAPAAASAPVAPPVAAPVKEFKEPEYVPPPVTGRVLALHGRPGEMVAEIAWSDSGVQVVKEGKSLRGLRVLSIASGRVTFSGDSAVRAYAVGEVIVLPQSQQKALRK